MLEGHKRRLAQEALTTQATILAAVTRSLAAYLERGDWKEAFYELLTAALQQTKSVYGFIGVVTDEGELRVLAHDGLVWDLLINRPLYEEALRDYATLGYVTFRNMDTLFGRAITTRKVVIANGLGEQRHTLRLPDGHPALESFLGVPIGTPHEVTGVVALANRPGGYGARESREIETLVQQAGGLCESYRHHQRTRAREEQRLQADQALRESEERFRIIARATHDVVWDWDTAQETVFVPEGFQKILGGAEGATLVPLSTRLDAIHPDDRSRVETSLRRALADGDSIWTEEYRLGRADGSYATVFDRGYVLRDASDRPLRMIGAMMDVTERRLLEAQFRQSQKLEAVGQLAGGVAHDFNNILTIIGGHASLLLEASDLDAADVDAVQQIAEAAERAASLTRQLLAFSRKQVLQVVDVDVNRIVGSMVRLLERILGEDITLDISLTPIPAVVRGDAGMIEQVIMNLAVNARDAMPAGGVLQLRTRLETTAAPEAAAQDVREGPFVKVSLTDHGVGIPLDVLPHVFEPFFTTKDVDRGTGLGLSTVYGIVRQHRGWVEVRSTVDVGTTVDIWLPAASTTPSAAEPPAPEPLKRGHETILLVEDEAAVRRLARTVLQRQGYEVVEADCGRTALAVWHEHRDRIDLVFTDMVMPSGLSGLELAEQFAADRPDIRVILTSGYSINLVGRDLTGKARIAFLPKPYSAAQLLAAVRTHLEV